MAEQFPDKAEASSGLRAHLLAAERMDDQRLAALQEELAQVFAAKLTPRGRIWWVWGLSSSTLFAIFGAVVLVHSQLDETLSVIWWMYTLGNVAMLGFSAYVLWRGVF